MSLETEEVITDSLLKELNVLHCLNLPEKPDTKRGSGLPTAGLGGGRLILVGGSHTSKIAALVGHSGITEYIPLPGQPLSSDAADSLEEKISSLDLGEGDILYLDLFSNTIFMGSD